MEETVNIQVTEDLSIEPSIHVVVELKQWDEELATYVATYVSEKQTTRVWKRTLTPILNDFAKKIKTIVEKVVDTKINANMKAKMKDTEQYITSTKEALTAFNNLPWYKKMFFKFDI